MSPPPAAGGGQDVVDVVLQQAQMVAFCIPVVGPVLAAAASIAAALYDAGKPQYPDKYTMAQAIADLGDKISQLPVSFKDQLTDDTVGGWQTYQWQCEKDIRDYLSSGSAKQFQKTVDSFSVLDADTVFAGFGDKGATPFVPTTDPNAPAPTPPAGNTPMAPLLGGFVRQDVVELDLYVKARTAYHAMLITLLRTQALVADPPIPPDCWTSIGIQLRDRLEESLAWGITHLDQVAAPIDYVLKNGVAVATAAAGANTNAIAWNARYTAALRSLRSQVFVDATTPAKVASYLAIRDAYQDTLDSLRAPVNRPAPSSGLQPGQPPKSGGLGKLLPNTARFLFETSVTGAHINVVANPRVSPGATATQAPGSATPACYFQLGSGDFLTQLTAAAEVSSVQTGLQTAYDAMFGSGRYALDAAHPPSPPPDVTLAVPLAPAGPVEDQVVALLYTTAPPLAVGALSTPTVAAQFTQVYLSVFTAIATWNAQPPTIRNVRVAMLGAADPTTAAGKAHNAALAGVIIDAAVQAQKANPSLVPLTVLINTDDSAGGAERTAFTTAALARKASVNLEGFDLPIT